MYNKDFMQDNVDTNVTGNNNYVNNEMDVNVNMSNNSGMGMMNSGCMNNGRERIINRTFVHEVPQDCFFMIEKQRSISIKIGVNKNTSIEYTSIDIQIM